MPASKYGQQRENGKKGSPKIKGIKLKNVFEKNRNFSALDERDCQAASLFAHWGQLNYLVAKGVLGQMGQINPPFHMHRGKIGQLFGIRGSPATNAVLCVDGPCKTTGYPPEHPRDTSHTFSATCCRLPIHPVPHAYTLLPRMLWLHSTLRYLYVYSLLSAYLLVCVGTWYL